MVNLTRIYTRTGDGGQTRLVSGELVGKADPLVEAYGTVDELNSLLGVVIAHLVAPSDTPTASGPLAPDGNAEKLRPVLAVIQQELFDLGSDVANPYQPAEPADGSLRILDSQVQRLESWCDEFGADLPKLRSFVLPGGTMAGSYLQLARTVCRRAERIAWRAQVVQPLNPAALHYLNRLSDLLFILGRYATSAGQEVLWVPGGERPEVG